MVSRVHKVEATDIVTPFRLTRDMDLLGLTLDITARGLAITESCLQPARDLSAAQPTFRLLTLCPLTTPLRPALALRRRLHHQAVRIDRTLGLVFRMRTRHLLSIQAPTIRTLAVVGEIALMMRTRL